LAAVLAVLSAACPGRATPDGGPDASPPITTPPAGPDGVMVHCDIDFPAFYAPLCDNIFVGGHCENAAHQNVPCACYDAMGQRITCSPDIRCVGISNEQPACLPRELNPNRVGGHAPSPAELQTFASGPVGRLVLTGLYWQMGSCPDGMTCPLSFCDSVRVTCYPMTRNGGSELDTFTDSRKCRQQCPDVPPTFGVDGIWNNNDRTTVFPAYRACSGVDEGPICRRNMTDPPTDPPDALMRGLFGHRSDAVITSGVARISLPGQTPVQTAVHGTFLFPEDPCTGASCNSGLAIDWRMDDVSIASVVSSATLSELALSGAAEFGSLRPDLTGVGAIPTGNLYMTGRGTGTLVVLGVPLPFPETRAYELSNLGPVSVNVDWVGHLATIHSLATVDTGDDPDNPSYAQVELEVSGRIINEPPTAAAGPDQTIECTTPTGASVTLDGSSSSDPENNIMTHRWTLLPFHRGDSQWVSPGFTRIQPLGTSEYRLEVMDSYWVASSDRVTVSVVDTTTPTIAGLQASPSCLWPPQHRFVAYRLGHELTADVADTCSGVTNVSVVSVTSSEGDRGNGIGSGNTTPDVIYGPPGSASERSGTASVMNRACTRSGWPRRMPRVTRRSAKLPLKSLMIREPMRAQRSIQPCSCPMKM